MTARYCPACGVLVAISLRDCAPLCHACKAEGLTEDLRRYAELLRKVEGERDAAVASLHKLSEEALVMRAAVLVVEYELSHTAEQAKGDDFAAGAFRRWAHALREAVGA